MRRTRRRKSKKINVQEFWDSWAQNYTSEFSKTCSFRNSGTPVRRPRRRKSQIWTFRNSGAPLRRARRRKSQQMDFQEFWESCALNKTSEIPQNALSGILGLLCAEQDVGNLKKNALSENLGLLCAEQDLGIIKKCTLRNSGTLPKFCVVRKYEMQGVTLAIFFLTVCLVGSVSRELCLNCVPSGSMKSMASLSPFFS